MLKLSALELLSPARDAQTGIAAIDHGADAVYIGGPAFGARAAAGNTLDEIARLAEYAHRYDARVFLALNTLFTNEELPLARKLAFDAADAGVDVLILQDMGLLAGPLPDIELHASTQCDIRTPEKAVFLEKAGFSQMVVARELSLDEVARIRARLSPETRIEYFIHGALCVSYSGQCYMSEALVHRSANRGACAQLCRLPYDVSTEAGVPLYKKKHVLSLRDNNQTEHLEALVDAGVSSFKIEGRLKDASYVKNITAWYRNALDAIIARRPELSRSSAGKSTFTFEPSPEKSFNRGRTDYFIEGRNFDAPYDLAELETPKAAGAPVGILRAIEPKSLLLKPREGVTLANGDGLTYRTPEGDVRGFSANRIEPAAKGLVRVYPREATDRLSGLLVGATILRNRDQAFSKLMAGDTARRRIPVTLAFTVTEDALDLVVTDGTSCGAASVAMELDPPANPEKNRASLAANLVKLGDTIYEAEDILIPEDLDVFVPASIANQLRRAAVVELDRERALARRGTSRKAPVAAAENPYPEPILGFNANVANDAARDFYAAHGARVTAPAFEIKPVANAPLMTCRHCVRAQLKLCPKMVKAFPDILEKTDRALLRPEPLILTNSAGERFRAEFHCRRSPCEMTITKC